LISHIQTGVPQVVLLIERSNIFRVLTHSIPLLIESVSTATMDSIVAVSHDAACLRPFTPQKEVINAAQMP